MVRGFRSRDFRNPSCFIGVVPLNRAEKNINEFHELSKHALAFGPKPPRGEVGTGRGAYQTNWAMSFPPTPFTHAWEIAKGYSTNCGICPCDRYHTVEIRDTRVLTMSEQFVMVSGVVRKDGRCASDSFQGSQFTQRRCTHDVVDKVQVKVSNDQFLVIKPGMMVRL